MNNGKVIWITGLSGAGKTSLGRLVVDWLNKNDKVSILLDGDELRQIFGANDHYDRTSRENLSIRYSKLCGLLASQNIIVVICTISLFHKVHTFNRKFIDQYFEVFLDTPIDVLVKRDPKNIYSQFSKGHLTDVIGLDLPAEFPKSPDLVIQAHHHTKIESSFSQIKKSLSEFLEKK